MTSAETTTVDCRHAEKSASGTSGCESVCPIDFEAFIMIRTRLDKIFYYNILASSKIYFILMKISNNNKILINVVLAVIRVNVRA